jgi:coenzyme F420-reducing hydrogenase alpha subunit
LAKAAGTGLEGPAQRALDATRAAAKATGAAVAQGAANLPKINRIARDVALGNDAGWYRVGPLARVNNADRMPTPLAEAERKAFMAECLKN